MEGMEIKKKVVIRYKMKKKIKHSEVRAYNFILNDLEKIGWIPKNPSAV